MTEELAQSDFIANALTAHLRSGCLPAEAQAAGLDRRPLIDRLRKRVEPRDSSWLLPLVQSAPDTIAGLACSLLRHQMQDSKVRACFEARWSSASAYLRNRIMWRLLDNPSLESSWHQVFRQFVFDEWEVFQRFNQTFYGPPETAVGSLLSRILDPSFPDSKKWIYLCCAPGVTEDVEAARAVIRVGLLLPNSLTSDVADQLLRGFPWSGTREGHLTDSPQHRAEDGNSFVADAVMSRLRSGVLPTDLEADFLNRLPLIESLRIRVRKDDVPWLFETIDGHSGEIAGLFLSLLKRFTRIKEVQCELQRRWEKGDAFLRAHLMWRLLDSPDLDRAWHEAIFSFVLAEWPTFRDLSLKFLGTPHTVVEQMIERIGDPNYVESKKWVCLCRVADVAANRGAARGLLQLGKLLPDPLACRVADSLLHRFYAEENPASVVAEGLEKGADRRSA